MAGAVRYELWAWDSVNGWQQLDDGALTDTSYTHRDLTPGTTYHYAIRAVSDDDETSAWSEYANANVTEAHSPDSTATPTATPTATSISALTPTPTPTAGALSAPILTAEAGAGQVTLTWETVAGAVRYDLWAWWDRATGWQRIDDGSLTGTSHTHSGLAVGTTYHYAIRAVDANSATSAWSEYANATVLESSVIPDTTEERAALVALYEATDGANWSNSDNWLTDEPLSAWHGVTTDESGHVTQLDLSENGLSGSFPDLGDLTNLTIIYLSANELTGPVPELSALTNLVFLELGNNQLTGPVPDLGALTSLLDLNLHNNQLSGQIPDLSSLTNLRELNLGYNQLTGPIPELGVLTNLTRLSLRSNELAGLIPDLSGLTSLDLLDLASNQLTGPVPDLSALTNLTNLDLTGNQLCLPADSGLTGLNAAVAAHLESLNLPSCASARPEERAALVAFYEATGGANWWNSDNWLTDEPLSAWHGVTTDVNGRVTQLSLKGNAEWTDPRFERTHQPDESGPRFQPIDRAISGSECSH